MNWIRNFQNKKSAISTNSYFIMVAWHAWWLSLLQVVYRATKNSSRIQRCCNSCMLKRKKMTIKTALKLHRDSEKITKWRLQTTLNSRLTKERSSNSTIANTYLWTSSYDSAAALIAAASREAQNCRKTLKIIKSSS